MSDQEQSEIELNQEIIPLCQETQASLKEFDKQLKKLIEFNETQLKRGEVNYATLGKSRVDALKNFHNIEDGVRETQAKVDALLTELLQKMPSLAKAAGVSVGMNHNHSGSTTEETE